MDSFWSAILIMAGVLGLAGLVLRGRRDAGPNACRQCGAAWVDKPGSLCATCSENPLCRTCKKVRVERRNDQCAQCFEDHQW
jgi:hypothetical protein